MSMQMVQRSFGVRLFAAGFAVVALIGLSLATSAPSAPAAAGTVVQVFATGLPATGVITAKIHDRAVPTPEYGGAAPGFPGLQQVNIRVPGDLPTMQTWVYVCGGLTAEQQSCSAPAMIWIAAK